MTKSAFQIQQNAIVLKGFTYSETAERGECGGGGGARYSFPDILFGADDSCSSRVACPRLNIT